MNFRPLRFTPAETLVLQLVRDEITQEEYDRLSVPQVLTRRYLVGVYQHGTVYGYTRGCRCDDCRGAHTDYKREYRNRVKED